MISYLSHTKLLNVFWSLLALFMLNISINVADASYPAAAEQYAFNEQESLIEFVLEEMLGIEDAIPESEDNDATQNSFLKKTSVIDHFIISSGAANSYNPAGLKTVFIYKNDVGFTNGCIDIVSPPPEV